MTEKQAETLAAIVGGEAWQSGGGVWLVTLHTSADKFVVFSGDAVCEYDDEEAFDESKPPTRLIDLGADDDRWVIQDDEGNVFYEHDEFEVGWRSEMEAEGEFGGSLGASRGSVKAYNLGTIRHGNSDRRELCRHRDVGNCVRS